MCPHQKHVPDTDPGSYTQAWFIGPRTGRFSKKNVLGSLVINFVQGENLNTPNSRVTHPFLVVQQLNHGHAEARTPASQNSSHPRWGSSITLTIKRDEEEEATRKQDLTREGWCVSMLSR